MFISLNQALVTWNRTRQVDDNDVDNGDSAQGEVNSLLVHLCELSCNNTSLV